MSNTDLICLLMSCCRDYSILSFFQDRWTVRDIRSTHRLTCVTWNDAVVQIPSWPQQLVAVPAYSRCRSYKLDWATFPASLKADVDAYLARLAGGDILAERDFKPLRASTLVTRTYQMHEAASAYVLAGGQPCDLRSIADLVTLDAVTRVLTFLLSRNAGKKSVQMFQFAGVLTTAAKYWVRVEEVELAKLKKLTARLKIGGIGLTPKNRSRLRQFDNEANVQALLRLPRVLKQDALASDKSRTRVALLIQTAVAIEILLMCPIRLRNLTKLEIGNHLIRIRKGPLHIVIPEDEVKNEVAIEMELPQETADLIDLYVTKYRPVLAKTDCIALFPGQSEGAKHETSLGMQIRKAILHRLGLNVNPHLFRHFAAKTYLERNPGAYGTVRLALGHKSIDTTMRYYCGTETAAAFKQLDNNVMSRRGAAPSSLVKARGAKPRKSTPKTPKGN